MGPGYTMLRPCYGKRKNLIQNQSYWLSLAYYEEKELSKGN